MRYHHHIRCTRSCYHQEPLNPDDVATFLEKYSLWLLRSVASSQFHSIFRSSKTSLKYLSNVLDQWFAHEKRTVTVNACRIRNACTLADPCAAAIILEDNHIGNL
jgi:hypothetical protein